MATPYNDSFTPFDDLQCEDIYDEIEISVNFDPEEELEYDEDDDWVQDPEDDAVIVDFVNEDGSLTPAGQEYLAQLDAEGAFV